MVMRGEFVGWSGGIGFVGWGGGGFVIYLGDLWEDTMVVVAADEWRLGWWCVC